jgi:preprotein translocase subunit SecD
MVARCSRHSGNLCRGWARGGRRHDGRPAVRRAVAVLALLAVAGCTAAKTTGGTGQPASSTTSVTFAAPAGTSAGQLQRAAQVLRSRLAAEDVTPATVDVAGDTIVVTAPGGKTDLVKASGEPAVLRLRPVRAGPFPSTATDHPGVSGADATALAKLDCARPTADDRADQVLAACQQDGTQKLLLEPSIIDGAGIKTATAQFSTDSGGWTITVEFASDAQATFADYTGKHNVTVTPDDPHNQLAFVLDGRVVSAPQIQDRITGPTEIAGSFTATTASTLAAAVTSGALPIRLQVQSVRTN